MIGEFEIIWKWGFLYLVGYSVTYKFSGIFEYKFNNNIDEKLNLYDNVYCGVSVLGNSYYQDAYKIVLVRESVAKDKGYIDIATDFYKKVGEVISVNGNVATISISNY